MTSLPPACVPSTVGIGHPADPLHLGIKTSLHKLRHYSATELITAGVDIRTVAGRLGHGSGGVTTLRVYAAWVSESDQRAAGNLASRMPQRPTAALRPAPDLANVKPSSPYEEVAVSLRQQIIDGTLPAGLPIPPVKELARQHGVSVGTVQRAVELVKTWGMIEANRGRRNLVRRQSGPVAERDGASGEPVEPTSRSTSVPSNQEPLDLEIRKLGQLVSTVRAMADPGDHNALGRLLGAAVKRNGDSPTEIDSYEMVVRRADEHDVLMTFVATVS